MEDPTELPQRPQQPTAGADEQKRAQEEQMRRDLMATVLDSGARERLARIALVSAERSRQIETILVHMAQTGKLKGRVSEEQLIDLLEQADKAETKPTQKETIIYQRRKRFDDDDDF